MNLNLRNVFFFVLLLSAALGTWVVSRTPPVSSANADGPTNLPLGYYLNNAVLLGTNTEGRVYYRVFAGRVQRAIASADLVLTDVRVEYEPETDIHWSMTARQASAPSERGYIDFEHDVRLSTLSTSDTRPTVIETDALRLHTESGVASSDQHVAIRQGNAEFEATGMRAELDREILELQSDVSARFAP